jgi:uncharacterized spore protein YtfJ
VTKVHGAGTGAASGVDVERLALLVAVEYLLKVASDASTPG